MPRQSPSSRTQVAEEHIRSEQGEREAHDGQEVGRQHQPEHDRRRHERASRAVLEVALHGPEEGGDRRADLLDQLDHATWKPVAM